MRKMILILAVFMLGGCFWVSSEPDLGMNDRAVKMVVLWDRKVSDQALIRSAWETSNRETLEKLTGLLNTASWTSNTLLPKGHSTRIILAMESGKVWEIVQSDRKRNLKMFERGDRGWSGWIDWSDSFLQSLANEIQKEQAIFPDLQSEYLKQIGEGSMTKTVSPEAQEQLSRYPGYPEMVWNSVAEKWEYAPE